MKTEAQLQAAIQKEVDLNIVSPTRKTLLEGSHHISAPFIYSAEDSAVRGTRVLCEWFLNLTGVWE